MFIHNATPDQAPEQQRRQAETEANDATFQTSEQHLFRSPGQGYDEQQTDSTIACQAGEVP